MLLLTHNRGEWRIPDCPGWPRYCWWSLYGFYGEPKPEAHVIEGELFIAWKRPWKFIGYVMGPR